jgi:hypothetical protein
MKETTKPNHTRDDLTWLALQTKIKIHPSLIKRTWMGRSLTKNLYSWAELNLIHQMLNNYCLPVENRVLWQYTNGLKIEYQIKVRDDNV